MPDSGQTPPRRPRPLVPGSRAVVVAPSWGGPAVHPGVYEAGLAFLRERLQLDVIEGEHARAPRATPRQRAADLDAALSDPRVRTVISAVGGEDSLLVLPHLDPDVVRNADAVVLGFSDATTLLVHLHVAGSLVTFQGPAVMAGLAQAEALGPDYVSHLREMLTTVRASHRYVPYRRSSEGYPDWSVAGNERAARPPVPDDGPRVVQGRGQHRGRLLGGCLEAFDFLRGTPFFPAIDRFEGRILFLETSEEAPPVRTVTRFLRSLGVAGVLDRLAALLFGRPYGYPPERRAELESALRAVVGEELGHPDLPILANLDFGHTDPQWILPLGVLAEVDCEAGTLALVEPWLRR